jgi:hypothetical protein
MCALSVTSLHIKMFSRDRVTIDGVSLVIGIFGHFNTQLVTTHTKVSVLSHGFHRVAGRRGRREFGNPEERERPSLEAATKQRLVKTVKILCVL